LVDTAVTTKDTTRCVTADILYDVLPRERERERAQPVVREYGYDNYWPLYHLALGMLRQEMPRKAVISFTMVHA
jgi:hypothetical protein